MTVLVEGLRYFGAIVLMAAAALFGGVALLTSELDAGARTVGIATALGVAGLAYCMWPRSATARSIAPAQTHGAQPDATFRRRRRRDASNQARDTTR